MNPVRILKLYFNELSKVVRQPFPYVALALLFLAPFLLVRNAENIVETVPSGFEVVYISTFAGLTTLIPLLVVIFCSTLVAHEIATGTARALLARPVSRFEFLTAKLMIGITFGAMALLFFAGSAAVSSIGLYAFTDSVDSFDGSLIFTKEKLFLELFISLVVSMLPIIATVTYGVMISVLMRNAITAAGTAVGIILTIDIIKHALQFGELDLSLYTFNSHLDAALKIGQSFALGIDTVSWRDMDTTAILVPLCSILVFSTVSYFVFLTRDVHE